MTKKHGGLRANSGRKPAKRKKESIFVYVYEDEVSAVGGKDVAKAIAEVAIARKAKNILNNS